MEKQKTNKMYPMLAITYFILSIAAAMISDSMLFKLVSVLFMLTSIAYCYTIWKSAKTSR